MGPFALLEVRMKLGILAALLTTSSRGFGVRREHQVRASRPTAGGGRRR